jgi:DNA-binding response OmpR family regulator
MVSGVPGRATVLVVDDEQDVADTYAAQLRASYDVRVAYGGEAALDEMDESVDAVLLDRRMPDIQGDEVLDRIRDQGYDCKVIMATAVDADLDILALDFDDYLSKPIRRDTLLETVEQQLEPIQDRDRRLDEFFKIVSTMEVLEDRLPPSQLDQHEEYQEQKNRAQQLGKELADELADFDEIVRTFREINRNVD